MLLLDCYFFFSIEFCKYISNIVESDDEGTIKIPFEVYCVDNAEDVEDLTDAIHGFH